MGRIREQSTLSQAYVHKLVSVSSPVSGNSAGGLIGQIYLGGTAQANINNVYSQANVSGASCVGGLIGNIYFMVASSSVSISNAYVSAFVFDAHRNSGMTGNLVGTTFGVSPSVYSFTQVYYDNQTFNSTLPWIGTSASVTPTSGTPQGIGCFPLFCVVSQNFSHSLWEGISLRIEYNFVAQGCLCPGGCNLCSDSPTTLFPTSFAATTLFPSTSTPTTNQPTTNFPTSSSATTNMATTFSSTTNQPTTNTPSTSEATTNQATIFFPSTNLPTSNIPTFNIPTSNIPTSNIPTTNQPATSQLTTSSMNTFILSTNQPPNTDTTQQTSLTPTLLSSTLTLESTLHNPSSPFPSAVLESTLNPTKITSPPLSTPVLSTLSPTVCPYHVPNCQNCPQQAPVFDLTQVNVSCTLFLNEWTWTFIPKNGTLINTGEIVLSGNTTTLIEGDLNNANLNISSESTVFIQGNFTQGSGNQIVFTFSPFQNNKSSPLNVGGCVSINGNISLNLETQPQQGTTNLQVISYNCSQQVNISSSQIQVTPNYNGSSCDTINSQTINQQGNLGVSLTTIVGNKCSGGKNLGLIIGLAVGIPCIFLIIGGAVAFRKWQERKELSDRVERMGTEMKHFQENPKFEDKGIQWTSNQK